MGDKSEGSESVLCFTADQASQTRPVTLAGIARHVGQHGWVDEERDSGCERDAHKTVSFYTSIGKTRGPKDTRVVVVVVVVVAI